MGCSWVMLGSSCSRLPAGVRPGRLRLDRLQDQSAGWVATSSGL